MVIPNKIAHNSKTFLRWISKVLLTPVEKELPFFICFVYCLGGEGLYYHSFIKNDILPADFLIWFCILFLTSWLVTGIVTLINNIFFKIVAYVFTIFIGLSDYFIMTNYGVGFSPTIATAIVETNTTEINGFVTTFLLTEKAQVYYYKFFFLLLLFIIAEIIYRKIKTVPRKPWETVLASIIVLIMLTCGVDGYLKKYKNLFISDGLDDVSRWELTTFHEDITLSNIYYTLTALNIERNSTQQCIDQTVQIINDQFLSCSEEDSLNIVLVIGESYNKWHSSLYGYHLNTSPRLCVERDNGRLFVFNQVRSMATFTSTVMRNILSCNILDLGEYWYEKPYLPAIFKQAGYIVSFWDNQKDFYRNASYSFALNSLLYNPIIQELSYTSVNDTVFAYDGPLIEHFIASAPKQGKLNFTIFHLMGQHFNALGRFPEDAVYHHFTADSINRNETWLTQEKKQNIADYDNATLYNDGVLNLLFNYYKDKNAVLIYFSDHGEEIFDYRDIIGRNSSNYETTEYIKHEVEVPFIIWCSDQYKMKNTEIVEKIKNATNIPCELDYISHLLFHIGKIQTNQYNPSFDIISDEYPKEEMSWVWRKQENRLYMLMERANN